MINKAFNQWVIKNKYFYPKIAEVWIYIFCGKQVRLATNYTIKI